MQHQWAEKPTAIQRCSDNYLMSAPVSLERSPRRYQRFLAHSLDYLNVWFEPPAKTERSLPTVPLPPIAHAPGAQSFDRQSITMTTLAFLS